MSVFNRSVTLQVDPDKPTLILDLDETLIHAHFKSNPIKNSTTHEIDFTANNGTRFQVLLGPKR